MGTAKLAKIIISPKRNVVFENWAKYATRDATVPIIKTMNKPSKFLILSTLESAAIRIARESGRNSHSVEGNSDSKPMLSMSGV
jgi:hypothetical protein